MSYTITWSRSAARAIREELPEAVAAACLAFILGPLAENPQRVGKPLGGSMDGLHSARRGEYRVIYSILEQKLVVHLVTIRHRRDAYR